MSNYNPSQAFLNGVTMIDHYGAPFIINVVQIAELVITSHRIVACDPYLIDLEPPPYTIVIPNGSHPVFLSIVTYRSGTQWVAYARVRFNDNPTETWGVAQTEIKTDPNTQGDITGYIVDAGTGCFFDAAALPLLLPDVIDYTSQDDQATWLRAIVSGDNLSPPIRAIDKELGQENPRLWSSALIDSTTGMNIVAFRSGWGDGTYPSFFGYDAQGCLTCLVTDFLGR